MEELQIKELDQLLKPILGPDKSVVRYTATYLTNPGENYISTIIDVKVKVRNEKTDEVSDLNVVAKMCPPNEGQKGMFLTFFEREVNMYTKVLKELSSFAEEHSFPEKIDILCDYYNSRLGLDSTSTTVDDDAVLLLENLNVSGFRMDDRFTGYDIETMKVILKDLALFHGVPLAYKLKNPKKFEANLMPYLSVTEKGPRPIDNDLKQRIENNFLRHAIEGNPKCAELSDKILKVIRSEPAPDEGLPLNHPYGTLTHGDLWLNNIMVKYVNGKATKSKIIDLQMCTCGSLAKDLVFLLFSSLEMSILEKHFDELVCYYHVKLLDILKFFGCNCEEYDLTSLNAEIERVLKKFEMSHILFMFKLVLAEKGIYKNFEDVGLNTIFDLGVSEKYKKRISDVILFFNKRNWL